MLSDLLSVKSTIWQLRSLSEINDNVETVFNSHRKHKFSLQKTTTSILNSFPFCLVSGVWCLRVKVRERNLLQNFITWMSDTVTRQSQIGKRLYERSVPMGVPDKFRAFTLPKLTSCFHTILYQCWKEQITCKYLCVLDSSTSLERDMSKMGLILSRRRLRIKRKLFNMLISFCNEN